MSRARWQVGTPGDLSVLDRVSSSNDFVYVTCSSEAATRAGLTLIADLSQRHLLALSDMCTDVSKALLLWRADLSEDTPEPATAERWPLAPLGGLA